MDNLTSRERERELEADLESGGTTSEEDSAENPVSIDRHEKGSFNKFWSSLSGSNSSSNVLKSGESADVNVFLIEKNSEDESNEHVSLVDYKCLEGKQKKNNLRKPTKPPRPPKGPTLDAADQKLVREIAEFAMRKRARNEKIKALKKMKVAKVSKSNTALSALIVTVIFCIIIIFQGIMVSDFLVMTFLML